MDSELSTTVGKGNLELQQTILRNCQPSAWLWAEKQTDCWWLVWRSEEQARHVMSLWELILCLHCDFLAALSLQEKHTKRWGGLYKRRMTSHEFQKSSQKKMVWRQRCIMSKDVHPSCCLAYCQQMWWILRVDVVSECNETGEIHEGHWYRAVTFNSESPHAGHSENILDANEFVLVTFLYLSLEEPLGAEYWAMWSFGFMQLLLFACRKIFRPNDISKTTPEDAPDRHLVQLTSSQAVSTLRQASQLHCPILRLFT